MKVLVCLKDFRMQSRRKVFTKGKVYPILDYDDTDEAEGFDVVVQNDDNERHVLPFYVGDSVGQWFDIQEVRHEA